MTNLKTTQSVTNCLESKLEALKDLSMREKSQFTILKAQNDPQYLYAISSDLKSLWNVVIDENLETAEWHEIDLEFCATNGDNSSVEYACQNADSEFQSALFAKWQNLLSFEIQLNG